MDLNSMKNVIILKNLPSNMVQEAYVVFKNNVNIHKIEKVEKSKKIAKVDKQRPKEYIVKEAEMIINDYISKVEEKEYEFINGNQKLKEKYKKLKALTILLAMFSILSIFFILLN